MRCAICGEEEGEGGYPGTVEARTPTDPRPIFKHLKCMPKEEEKKRKALVYRLCYFQGNGECGGTLYKVRDWTGFVCEKHRKEGGGQIRLKFSDDMSRMIPMEGKPETMEAYFEKLSNS